MKFIVGKKFAGIEKAWLDRNRDGQYGDDELLVSGKGGAFVVDRNGIRYESALSPDGAVAVEDAG
ncbi:MAG TPA: hypothetical protein PLQ23_06660, partial [Dermatophilaceae bacterium]|nr:hypothetical protein [Dermatophilaceae bacterium]